MHEPECSLQGRFTNQPNRRLAGHLLDHAINWFWFLDRSEVDATNYRGEQAMVRR